MKTTYKIIIIAFTLFLTSCEDVVNIELDTAPAKLVIDAYEMKIDFLRIIV